MASKFSYYTFPTDDPHANYNMASNKYFLTFWQIGISASFIVMVGIRWAIAMVGFVLNLLLVSVSILNRNYFPNTCNLLISLNALFAFLFEFSLTIGLVLKICGFQFVSLNTCFLLQTIPIFCRNMVITTLFAIGIDRLLSVVFVIWHAMNGQSNLYRAALIAVCSAHGLFFVVISAQMAMLMPELRVICISSDDSYQGGAEQLLFMINTTILILLLLCYLLIWVFLRIRANNNLDSTKRIIKSLTLTAMTISICWLSYNAVQAVFLPAFSGWINPVESAFLTFGFSILPYVAMGLNAPMLFIYSKDYRAALFRSRDLFFSSGARQSRSNTTVAPKPTQFLSLQRTGTTLNLPNSSAQIQSISRSRGPFNIH